MAGTVATDSAIRVRVNAVGEDTALAGIQRLVAEGWGTLVGYDYEAGRAAPFPPSIVERLRAEEAG